MNKTVANLDRTIAWSAGSGQTNNFLGGLQLFGTSTLLYRPIFCSFNYRRYPQTHANETIFSDKLKRKVRLVLFGTEEIVEMNCDSKDHSVQTVYFLDRICKYC